jgi:GntR family transcriptional repressor for pyruvate dehydrogenase complex
MTRQKPSLDTRHPAGKRALLRPLPPVRNLTDEVIARIKKEISSGRLTPGARLPTEQELMAALGVSRTVVREAVAALRADGLITTRQGSGAYVAADVSRVPFRIDPEGLSSIEDVLEVMELRLAIEVEAAARAAQRITPRSLASIERVLGTFEASVAKGEGAANEDFAFHLAIAEASGNSRFAELLEFLGRHVIPRQSIRVAVSPVEEQRKYLARIQSEHWRIYEALRGGDPGEARRAMREHLTRSLKRYRRLAERHRRVA